MKTPINYILLLFTLICITGCREKENTPQLDLIDFGHIAAETATEPSQSNLEKAQEVATAHPHQFATMLSIMGIEDESVESWLNSPVVKGFSEAVDSYAPSYEEITDAISYTANASTKLDLKIPAKDFATAIWGRPQSILFADSTMYIALNHYLGSDHPAYASLPVYRRMDKNPESLKYDIAEAIVATSYPYPSEEEGTIANRLMYEGAIIWAKMGLVKDPDEAVALGYNSSEMEWLNKNEEMLWKKMLASKFIFDRSEMLADKLFAPSPATTALASDAPGRAGRYIGYQLIKSFFKANPDVSISEYLTGKMYMSENPLIGINYNP